MFCGFLCQSSGIETHFVPKLLLDYYVTLGIVDGIKKPLAGPDQQHQKLLLPLRYKIAISSVGWSDLPTDYVP